MKKRRGSYRLALAVLGLFALVLAASQQFRSQAVVSRVSKNDGVTRSYNPTLENYDIRLDKAPEAEGARAMFRQGAAKSESDLKIAHKQVEKAISNLERSVPDLKIEYSPDLAAPEMIGTDILKGTFLTGQSTVKNDAMVRAFINQNKALYGLTSEQVSELKTVADYVNPDGNVSFVDLQQRIDGIEMFRGEVRAMITKQGEIARMINNLAPGLDYDVLSRNAGNPADAVRAAAKLINHEVTSQDLIVESTARGGKMVTFERGQFADPTTAEMMYFPIESGVARLAWRVLLWEPVAAYYVVVDAETGRMLWRKNITDDQTQTATYGIYGSESPSPLSPTNATPGSGIQGASVARITVTAIGNEAPNPGANNLGWITDGANITDGNNVEAGLDIVAPDGVDAPVNGSPTRVFDFTYNPPPGGSDAPSGAAYRNGIVTNLFYWTNRYHDFVYSAGFTELGRNFQNDNFGRGGVAADRVRGEAQDSSGTNNANFSTPADGGRGRMQMYLFTGPSPQRDGSIDGDVFAHELTHGTSNRLIGNSTGLGNNRGGSMGEGWGDFYGRMLFSSAGEDVNAVYAMGGYVTLNFLTLGTDNYYYGIRRFPYAVKTNTGGPMNRPHNPLTLADIDPAQINTSDGAYPITPWITNTATEVHNAGEVWCMMLLEVRARIITRLGWAAGNERMLQIATNGMKVTPTSPNFIQARDAILSADQTMFGGSDSGDIWAGFATRGAGFGAQDGLAASAVVQSFNLPNLIQTPDITISDSPGNNNGFPEPGEPLLITVPVQNPLSDPATGVTVSINGGTPFSYGTINGSATVTNQIPYTIPAGAACGSDFVFTFTINSSMGPVTPAPTRTRKLGVPSVSSFGPFSNTTAIPILDNLPSTLYPSPITVAGTTGPFDKITVVINGFTHTFPSDLDLLLVGPGGQKFMVMSDAGSSFDVANINLTMEDPAAAIMPQAQLATGTFQPTNYDTTTDAMPAPAPGAPYDNPATAGSATLVGTYGAVAANGVWNLYVRDDVGQDTGTIAGGWSIAFSRTTYTCNPIAGDKAVVDFDGDHRTDISVFRPGNGTWYIQRSTAGPLVQTFGVSSDKLVPGDYDGDGKTDIAVFRTNTWYILRSSNGTLSTVSWGSSGDVPKQADYDGDGKTDCAIFRPGTSEWWILRSSDLVGTGQVWGSSGDVAAVGDFDGDNKSDLTVFRPGTATWYVLRSSNGTLLAQQFGASGDKLVPGDWNGDGTSDFAVFRPSNNTWYTSLDPGTNYGAIVWGTSGDIVVPGDYDGDGKTDAGVYRPSTSTFFLRNSNSPGSPTVLTFGTSGDQPVPNSLVP